MFRRIFAACVCLVVAPSIASLAMAQDAEKPEVLKVGDEAPEFEALDDTGEVWKSIDHVGKKILVVYFYPKDMTPGCTKQACSYRDAHEQLADEDVEVVGVSRDTVESHQKFKRAENLNFTLLADPDGKVTMAFGVKPIRPGVSLASRWTFVIDLEGHVAHKDEKVDPTKDVANIMKVIAALKAKAK